MKTTKLVHVWLNRSINEIQIERKFQLKYVNFGFWPTSVLQGFNIKRINDGLTEISILVSSEGLVVSHRSKTARKSVNSPCSQLDTNQGWFKPRFCKPFSLNEKDDDSYIPHYSPCSSILAASCRDINLLSPPPLPHPLSPCTIFSWLCE